MTVAALFVETGGCYFGLPDVDPWDEARDARRYAGPHPVVAHPPCDRWCQMAPVNQSRYGHKIGDDGGWGPVRYEYINERGQASMLNGLRYWVFRRNPFPAFHGIVPLRIFGRDLSAIGLWRMQGSVWSVSQPSVDKWGHRTRDWQFRDVREVS